MAFSEVHTGLQGSQQRVPSFLDSPISGAVLVFRFALEDLRPWQIDRISHAELIREAWQHRHNVSAYDAFYIVAAQLADAPLLTADGPLSRAPLPGVIVQNIRLG